MQNSPLQLEEYILKELHFAIEKPPNAPLEFEEVEYDQAQLDIAVRTEMRNDDPRAWRSEITVRTKPVAKAKYPYTFAVSFIGFFRFIEDFPAHLREPVAKANAPAILYASAREILIGLTSRGRFPAIMLPSVTFVEPPKPSATQSKKRTPAKKK